MDQGRFGQNLSKNADMVIDMIDQQQEEDNDNVLGMIDDCLDGYMEDDYMDTHDGHGSAQRNGSRQQPDDKEQNMDIDPAQRSGHVQHGTHQPDQQQGGHPPP